MNTRKPRFTIPDELYKTYCEDPKPLWNNIFTTLVTTLFTTLFTTQKNNQKNNTVNNT